MLLSPITLTALKAGAAVATKNAATTATAAVVATVPFWFTTASNYLGVFGVAAFSAFVGAACRWAYFQLSLRAGITGMIISPILAFVFAQTKIPLLETLIGTLPIETAPMINGFIIGVFGLLVLGYVSDFIEAYLKKKAGLE